MNIYKKQWEKDFLKTLDISWELFPKIAYADEIAANVTKKQSPKQDIYKEQKYM